MTRRPYLLAIDQGTTSTRAILFDSECLPRAAAQKELAQIFPNDGWVEHDPEAIWADTMNVCRQVMAEGRASASDIAAIGITNQRETTVVWERASGRPIHNAIVWQDRRTAGGCRQLAADGHAGTIGRKSGLVIDPYFSGTKIAWLLDNVAGARAAAEAGKLAFGTIDSFLLWRLTGGRVHATDATNASRTMAFNIHSQEWDDELLEILRIPRAVLPDVRDNVADFGVTDADLFGGAIAVGGMAGDQQAATVGQACFVPGMIKSTYGTGCFALLNTGDTAVESKNKLLTTVAYRLDGKPTYAVEGSIFVAGAAIQWLRDGLKLIAGAPESETLARSVADAGGVYMVPAFTGLGAPYWDPDARGALLGLTRDTGVAQVVRAALEAVCYQTLDLMRAMEDDGAAQPRALRVDGGMVANDWLVQHLADILGLPVERPTVIETTAVGAAFLAGLKAGVFASLDDVAARWKRDRRCEPTMEPTTRDRLYAGWRDAVRRVRSREVSPQK
ncbi:MAG: glycerol kinase GlpK [Rhodospirillales bacterium]|nr:glycerol kinase GlpK [Rhodospirillales bacterium]